MRIATEIDAVNLWVPGIPRPQGSMKAIVTKTGRVFMKQGDTLAPWRNSVVSQTEEAIENGAVTFPSGPLMLDVWFYFPRPKSHPKKRIAVDRNMHYKMPDLDKLVRAVGDALAVSELIGDDDQITDLSAHKRYSGGEYDSMARVGTTTEGALIRVMRAKGGYVVGDDFRR